MKNHLLHKSVIKRRGEVYPKLNEQFKTMGLGILSRKEKIISHMLLIVFLVSILFPYKAYGNVMNKEEATIMLRGMGIPYYQSEPAFLSSVKAGDSVRVKLFLAAGTNTYSKYPDGTK